MKKILLLLFALTTMSPMALAQRKNDQRTLTTKIADVLAELPAKNTQKFDENMQEIAAMGKEGLLEMAGMLSAPGKGDNSSLKYALGGYSFYVTKPSREDLRQISVDAYCQALQKPIHEETKDFLIRQLQMVGKDEAVYCLEAFLGQHRLCDPAARALTSINTATANKALLQALQGSDGPCRLSLVQALGDTRYEQAAGAITALASSDDPTLRKLALYALANIADPGSEPVLAKAAEKEAYIFTKDNATAAYLLYAERLIEKGLQRQAEKIAQSLMSNTKQNQQIHTRIAALELLTTIQGEKSTALLVKAMGDSNPEYRAAALQFAGNHLTPASINLWVKQAKKSDARVEAEIINMLGQHKAKAAMPAVLKALSSKHEQVRLAAIGAAGQIGNREALPELMRVMQKTNQKEAAAVRDALFMIDAQGLTEEVANALQKVPPHAQAALVTVLGHRAATDKINEVFKYVKSEDLALRTAALSALEQMVTKDHLPQLFSLLHETTRPEEVSLVLNAIVAAVHDYEDASQQAAVVLKKMEEAPRPNKPQYFKILANIGGEHALNAVAAAYNSGNDEAKREAVEALSAWKDASAAKELYHISKNTSDGAFRDQALKGYVHAVSISDYPAEQKLLLLRKAMDIAKTTEQKQLILKQVGKSKTFPALAFAGRYLDDPALQQEAAHAVMSIALSNNTFSGDIMRELLNKTIQVMDGPDSEYHKKSLHKFLAEMPQEKGYVALFNGKDLSGWKGLVANPLERAKMSERVLSQKQKVADEEMHRGWKVNNGELLFTGEGNNIATVNKYGDFEMFVDWKIYDDGHKKGDAGIYLRGSPQVQIWDTSRVDAGAQVGSGGLYNNQINPKDPLKVADNPLDEWNNFHIIMKGDRVTVYLNGELVTDNVILENYWDRSLPIFPEEQIELQAHGSRVAYRDLYIREIPRPNPFVLSAAEKKEGFKVLFDGSNMHHWMGNTKDYVIEDGVLVVRKPEFGSGGNLFTKEEYSDFIFRFEFKLTPGANNGLGIRAPLEGDAAYTGMELQILDNEADIYKNLKEYQYHGSVYGVIPAKRGYLKPPGEWNYQEVIVKGPKVKVILNRETILDGDIQEASKNGTIDGKDHPGLTREKGHIGFLGHGSTVWFRNIRIKDLSNSRENLTGTNYIEQ